jgi:NAD(P)-dependent dehydrogenase (short-subunit alcohol dehydrogenase family)
MFLVSDKVAIVTGAGMTDSSVVNIGGAVATELATSGAQVVVADVDEKAATRLAEHLNGTLGAEVVTVWQTDVRSEEQVRDLVSRTLFAHGRLDIVINNAGIFPGGDSGVAELATDVWDDVMAVNARGPMLLTKHAIPALKARGGAIVNTSSTHSFAGDSRLTAYGAAKAAVNALTAYTATQHGRDGIRCNAVCPGSTLSPPALLMPEESREIYARHTLNPSLNKPTDVARVIAFLASDAAHAINGMVIRADGGLLAHQPFVPDFLDPR